MTTGTAIRPGTWAMLGACAVAVGLAWGDPWSDERTVDPLSSNRADGRRLLAEIGDVDVAVASIELAPPAGPVIRLQPDPAGGHRLTAGDEILGPADPEAVEGLWASLRMATTLRAVAEGTETGLPAGGTIALAWPGGQRRLVLGRATADDVGLYGQLEDGAPGTEGLWVVERELGMLLEQAPRAWLAQRAVVIEGVTVEAVVFADGGEVVRGADGLWRADAGILQPDAIETRIERVISARMDPLMPAEGLPTPQPWLTLRDVVGTEFPLRTAGACPGREGRVVLVRGPGLAGCIDAALVEDWDLAALLHGRLIPVEYGQVLSIEQRIPDARTLARYGGGWRLEEVIEDREIATELDEAEVYRWYQRLYDAEVERWDGAPPVGTPEVTLVLALEQGVALELTCHGVGEDADAPTRVCRRDEGPWLRVRQDVGGMVLTPERFAERKLVRGVSSEDARAVEILAGEGLPTGQRPRRQSAHFDLGVWRLDAPVHPDGDDALDSTRLEGLIAAVGGLRAESWAEPPTEPPHRIVRIDQVARSGVPDVVAVAMHEGCVAVVEGQRPALLSETSCRRMNTGLLFDDPLYAWLDRAEGLEITEVGGSTVVLTRAGEAWTRADGQPPGELAAVLEAFGTWRATDVLDGAPDGATQWVLRVRPNQGKAFEIDIGDRWVQIADADWRYVGGPIGP